LYVDVVKNANNCVSCSTDSLRLNLQAIQNKINALWRNVAVAAVTLDVAFALLPTVISRMQ